MRVEKGMSVDVPVLLLSSDDFKTAITSIPYNGASLVFKYAKAGGSSQTKTLLVTNWVEVGEGIYRVTLNSVETDTLGTFIYWVTYPNTLTYQGVVQVIPVGNSDVLTPM